MVNENNVLERLRHWLDDSVPDSELLPLSTSCLASVRMRLRDDVNEEDPRVISAAAAITLYQYQLKQQILGGALHSFKAGDVSLQSAGDPLEASAKLRDDCLRDAAELFKDGDFVFLSC